MVVLLWIEDSQVALLRSLALAARAAFAAQLTIALKLARYVFIVPSTTYYTVVPREPL